MAKTDIKAKAAAAPVAVASPAKKAAKPAKAAKAAKSPKADKVKREPSAYNLFMRSELAKVKKAQPTLNHKEAFTAAAGNWKNSSANPNKGK